MMITTRGRYGLRAIIDLAVYQSSGAIPLREISRRQNISEQYLEQLFANLRKEGIIKSVRGAHGGYLLNREPEDITVRDIITSLEGPIAPSECVLEEECKREKDCITHDLWQEIKERIDDYLDSISLADLIKKYQNNNNFLGSVDYE